MSQLELFANLRAFQDENNLKGLREQISNSPTITLRSSDVLVLIDEVQAYRSGLPPMEKRVRDLVEELRQANVTLMTLGGEGFNPEKAVSMSVEIDSLKKAILVAERDKEALESRYNASMRLSGAQHDFLCNLLREHGVW